MINAYDNLNNIETISFEAGDNQTFEFNVYDEDGFSYDILTSGTWLLCPYGDYGNNLYVNYPITINGYIATLTIPSSATNNLSGKYIQQLTLLDISGESFVAQGIVLITPSGNS